MSILRTYLVEEHLLNLQRHMNVISIAARHLNDRLQCISSMYENETAGQTQGLTYHQSEEMHC